MTIQRLTTALFLLLSLSQVSFAEMRNIQGTVVDSETRAILNDVTVSLLKNGIAIPNQVIKNNLPFSFQHEFSDTNKYHLKASKEGFKDQLIDLSNAFEYKKLPKFLTISLGGDKNAFIFKGSILNRESSAPVGDAKVTVLNTMTGESSQVVSNLRGEYSFNVLSGYDYNFIVKTGKHLKRFARINYCGDRLGKNNKFCLSGFSNVSLNPNGGISGASLLVDKIELGKKFKVDNIYYDYNKASLRSDSIPNLKKVVSVLQDNPQIIIELGSHADSRGSDSYNLKLSQRRAESAVKYINKSGIDSNRIKAKGYGESVLTNDCSNGVKCSDKKHENNRRTELTIIRIDESKINWDRF